MEDKEWINKIPLNFDKKEELIKSIQTFRLKEKFILDNDLNERTLTHKLAEYLQENFLDFNVDCEYNRMMKEEDYVTKTLELKKEEGINNFDTTAKTVYPDIIIHRRGDDQDNLLVIEVKKNGNHKGKDFDIKKLNAFIKDLNYKFGIYLEFDNTEISEMEWFPTF